MCFFCQQSLTGTLLDQCVHPVYSILVSSLKPDLTRLSTTSKGSSNHSSMTTTLICYHLTASFCIKGINVITPHVATMILHHPVMVHNVPNPLWAPPQCQLYELFRYWRQSSLTPSVAHIAGSYFSLGKSCIDDWSGDHV